MNNIFDKINLIVYDFDGVMTDDRVLIDEHGSEFVFVNRSDGLAISFIKKLGLEQIIISSEQVPLVKKRGDKLGIQSFFGVGKKEDVLKNFCKKNNYSLDNVVFIGNDLNDLIVMNEVGFPICPKNAHPEIKNISKYVLPVNGGFGVVRSFYDLLTKGGT